MGTRREGGWTCQGLLIAPGNIIDLDLLLPLLPAAVGVSAPPPPHSSGVLPGHITRHCGTAWRLQHTVSSLTMHLAWAFFFTAAASHARTRTRTRTHTHTHLQCSASLWQFIAAQCVYALLGFQLLQLCAVNKKKTLKASWFFKKNYYGFQKNWGA